MNYAEWPLSAPVNLTWEITHHCNLRCIHCLSDSRSALPGELDLEQCRGIVDQLAELKVFEINFGGGEPLLNRFFLNLLEYIHSKGLVTCVSTNGTLVDDGIAKALRDTLTHIQVSLDGAVAETNDRIRGSGSFQQALRGIQCLSRNQVPFSINTVVTSQNLGQFDRLKELAASYGAGLRVSRFRPSGRARQCWDELKLSNFQLEELSTWLSENPGTLTGDSFFSVASNGRRELGLDMCGAGKLTCCIDPVGSTYPCAFLQEAEFCAGNLQTRSFREIWNNSQVFRDFRKLAPESCLSCGRFENCRGGCPAVAHFVRRDLNSADPECLVNWGREVSRDRAV